MKLIVLEAANKSRKDLQEGLKSSLKDQNVILISHGLILSNTQLTLEEHRERA